MKRRGEEGKPQETNVLYIIFGKKNDKAIKF